MLHLDINRRTDFLVQKISEINPQRIITIALPFLSLHPTTALLSSVGTALYQLYSSSPTKEGDAWEKFVPVVASIGLSIIFPKGQMVLSGYFFFAEHGKALFTNVFEGRVREAGGSLLQISNHALYIASAHYGTPAWA